MTTQQDHEARVPTARKATRQEVGAVADTLADALADDPFSRWVLAPVHARATRVQRLRRAFHAVVARPLASGDHEVFVVDDGDAVAVWKGVGAWKTSAGELVTHLPAHLRALRGGFARFLRAVIAAERFHPDAPHYYLAYLGTRTARQGHGLGSAAIMPVLDRCDDEGLPAYLETTNPRNEPFYCRHGFVRSGEITVPKGCPPIVPMWRDPR